MYELEKDFIPADRDDYVPSKTMNRLVVGNALSGFVLSKHGLKLSQRKIEADHKYSGESLIRVNGHTSAVTITLLDKYLNSGNIIVISDEDFNAATHNIILDPEGSTKINNASTLSITTNGGVRIIYGGETQWYKIL